MSAAQPHLLMTDFDGTLSEIVGDPERALPHPRALSTLRTLERDGHEVYVISGRSRSDLGRRLGFVPTRLIGLHGLEWPGEYMNSSWRDEAREVMARLPDEPGLLLEDKGYTVAVHYRSVMPHRTPQIITLLEEVPLPKHWEMIRGKCVREYRPKGAGKGSAVQRLMNMHPDLPALFIGDDLTDEAAFEAVQERGGRGVKVGNGPTAAQFRVGTVTEAVRFLAEFCLAEKRSFTSQSERQESAPNKEPSAPA